MSVPQIEEGICWLQKSASMEYPPAESTCGHLNLLLQRQPALQWIRKSAQHGYRCSCHCCLMPSSSGKEMIPNSKQAPSIVEAIQRKVCTYSVTRDSLTIQSLYECIDCGLRGKCRICETCKDECHKGHGLVTLQPLLDCGVCDCGLSGTCRQVDFSKMEVDQQFQSTTIESLQSK